MFCLRLLLKSCPFAAGFVATTRAFDPVLAFPLDFTIRLLLDFTAMTHILFFD